jgi:predicted permease
VIVVGVLQPAPFFPNRVDAFLNLVNSEHHLGAAMQNDRSHRMTEVIARLKSGATVEQARAEVRTVVARSHDRFKEHYDPAAHYLVSVIPFKEVLGERAKLTVWLLMASAAFVLIIAVANVANLTLMRGVRREHELAVRAALGAGVARLRRLLFSENLVLAVFGGVAGIALAFASMKLLTSLAARYSPRANEIRLDGVAFAFAVALSMAVAVLLSSVASLPREGRFAPAILAGSQRIKGSLRWHRVQRGLVVVQVAVSVVLLAGAGLLTRTMMRLAEIDTGLTTSEVLTMQVGLLTSAERRSSPEARAAANERYRRMRDEIAALPGVVEVGIGPTPLRSTDLVHDVAAETRPLAVGEATPRAELRPAGATYFRAAGIPLLEGRGFSTADRPDSGGVVIVNKALAVRLFGDDKPLGRRIAWTNGITPELQGWRTIVGVVGNTLDGGLDAKPRGEIFLPFEAGGGLVIRADRNVAALAAAATRVVRRIAPTAVIENVLTIAQLKDQGVAPRRQNAMLISLFSALAVVIAAVGIAGVLAFSVSARTNEIGIRMSLGADSGTVQRMILGEGGALLAIGLVLGVAGSFFSARLIDGLLFGVAPGDPVTFVVVAGIMAVVGIAACWIPAVRAARIDPVIAMRA